MPQDLKYLLLAMCETNFAMVVQFSAIDALSIGKACIHIVYFWSTRKSYCKQSFDRKHHSVHSISSYMYFESNITLLL